MQNSPDDRDDAHDHAGERSKRIPVSRRGFLVGSGLAGAAGLVASNGFGSAPAVADALTAAPAVAPAALGGSAAAAQAAVARGHTGRWHPDTTSPRFTVAVMPDTQYMFDGAAVDQAPMRASLEYVVREQARHNTVFLVHLGDLTQNGAASEMRASGAVFDVLDRAGAPYSVLAGNHDVDSSTDDQRGRTPYLDVFGPQRFRKAPGWIGSSPDGYNTAHRFTAAGREWVVLALDWRTSASGLAWASSVLAARPHAPVILTTHALVDSDASGGAAFDPYGQQLWDSFISKHDQVFLTLNGHYWGPGRTTAKNAVGHDVALHLTNYQNRYYGGAAMIRLYHVDLERNVIDVETLSPFLLAGGLGDVNELAAQETALSGDVDRFTMAVDFDARFRGLRAGRTTGLPAGGTHAGAGDARVLAVRRQPGRGGARADDAGARPQRQGQRPGGRPPDRRRRRGAALDRRTPPRPAGRRQPRTAGRQDRRRPPADRRHGTAQPDPLPPWLHGRGVLRAADHVRPEDERVQCPAVAVLERRPGGEGDRSRR
nr:MULTISPECIES: metallophosphoesterase [unclassified Curtobacterium]